MKGKTVLSAVLAAIMILTIAASAVAATDDGEVTAFATTTCDSCSDCTNKLNGDYDTVVLTTDLINVKGSGITFGADDVVFDGGGHIIDGDDTGEFESGITMNGKSGNTIRNCVITDFESGITLYGSSKNEIYENEIRSNYYDGIWISEESNSNNIHHNIIEDNGKYGVFFSSNSNGNTFSENTVCSNPTDIHDSAKNSGDENVCDTTANWNDAGTTGCTRDCASMTPDLVITNISNDDGTICYEIQNIGDATASEGHYTTLFVDGLYQIKEQVDVDLAPGASVKRCFDYYTWNCTPPGDVVEVCADYGDFVDESDEENNCLNVTWRCTSPAPPGDAIIYHADYGAGIWRIDPDGSENTQLSDHGWFAEYSPENSKIAFGEYYQNGIWVMNADGTGQVKLTSSGNAPTWSPDGTRIAYHVGGTTVTDRRIWVMDADGSNAHKLSESPGDFPAWSPDGTKIAYCGEVEKDIRLIHPDGTGDTQLCADGALPAWSPDGKKIAHRSLTDGCIWTMNADGSGNVKISTNSGKHPAWSSDGAKIAYEGTTGIWVIGADGTDEHLINQGGHAPDWMSPGIVGELPDLVITDVWEGDDGGICYQIRNIGEVTAPKGHYVFLLIDGIEVAGDPIDSELGPGKRLKRCINYAWQCSPPDDTITVCADHSDRVDETDETNNCRNERWKCDETPPVIVSGPVVSEVTQSSVTISWTTDEYSDSVARFGRTAGMYEDQKFSLKMKQEHKVILKDLLPSTTYRYLVESTDASENTVVSQDGLFETSPLPDDEPPVVHALNITRGKGDFLYYEMSADATDNIGVERVEFYIDGKLIGTDYSAPYQCHMAPVIIGMTREEFFGVHMAEAVVFDRSACHSTSQRVFDPPDECRWISIDFEYPYPDRTLYTDGDVVPDGTTVPIKVYAAVHTQGIGYDWMGGDFAMEEISAVSRVEFYVNGVLIGTEYPPSNDEYFNHIYTCDWDASGFPPRTHAIMVKAIASEDCERRVRRDVEIEHGEPSLDVKREVTRIGNCFRVELTVENHGTLSAQFDRIEDNVDGFQPIEKSTAEYDVITRCSDDGRDCDIEIDLPGSSFTLEPGEDIHVEYLAVPVLYRHTIEYAIGAEEVRIVGSSVERFDRPCTLTSGGELLSSSVDPAIGSSDYLIVTYPPRLFGQYVDDDVNELLSSMASLGKEKGGVLGYLDSLNRFVFKDLIEPGGDWSNRLRDDWTSEGYLLIVGETEIVPSLTTYDRDIRDATVSWTGGHVFPVTCVDNYYADISGDDNLPELIVARIIGDSADQLITPIETSLLDQFERTDAFVISGTGSGQSSFETNADEVASIIDDEFTVDLMHGGDYANDAARLTQFTTRAQDKDVLFYRNHGSVGCWSHTICTWNFPVNFGNSYPFAFGSVCLSGHFEGSYCIGEAFLDSGAGVYLGATEGSGRSANNDAGKKFFNRWIDSPKSLGQAFKETKRELGTSNDYKRLWVLEYNLYGDPKYGSSASDSADSISSSTTLSQKASWQPISSFEVTVPDYEVTTIDGLDHVEIPDGQLLLVPDMSMVPYYVTSIDYTSGYEVDDVVLTERSGLTIATGLDLPIVSMDPGADGSEKLETPSESTGAEWYPEEEYHWEVIENPNGSTTLLVMMYPFYYNPLTTDVEFYKNYKFEINYTTSNVEIAALRTDKDTYQQGDDVLVNLWLNNSGDAQDVLVDAVVKAGGSGEIASGLLLQTLRGFEGIASFSPHWDSSGVDPGYYFVEVTLKDISGDVLDRTTEMFRLGISFGKITSFTATPECFDIGDEIEIEMAFENNGTVKITGTAVIRVLNSTGYATEEFRHNVTNLTPSGSVSFSDAWDTSGAEAVSSYTIIGYVLYDSRSTDPAAVTVRNIVMGDLNSDGEITHADAGIALRLAASGEYDPAADVDCDGEVSALDALMIAQIAAGNIELEGCET
uniref:Tol-Pal system protein TolB n=1 Tax=Candidatus Methanophaga sp. ANME-1 ERB7 TaxID=2759913 RepID=A0A7G9Z1Q9_9EURY|nr:Tol-Pal system protein TolB [Methanosarcinales archaeon ANME-1 ERB7]